MSRASGKKVRQEASARRALRAVSGQRRNRTPLVVVGVVLALAVAFGLGWWFNRDNGMTAPAAYPVSVEGAVVTAGKPGASVTVDVYEDYLCPQCERFESRYGNEVRTALNEGRILVRYHHVAILDELTNPPGYSTRAANAALCAAGAGIFPPYHDKLYAEQPAEGSAGLSDDELIAFGTDLGAPAGFDQCVRSGSNAAAVTHETQAAASNPGLLNSQGLFGTPTVVVNGQRVNLNDSRWLQDAIAGR